MTTVVTKERPILFNAEMVRAILEGRKTQTRRAVKPKRGGAITGPAAEPHHAVEAFGGGKRHIPSQIECLPCPYGVPGDRPWVRETWCSHWSAQPRSGETNQRAERVVADARVKQRNGTFTQATADNPLYVYYRATFGDNPPHSHLRWKPSIHMPRWASRINLLVKAVRVERARDITREDVAAEGIRFYKTPEGKPAIALVGDGPVAGDYLNLKTCTGDEFIQAHFAAPWDSINAKRGYGWNTNPWVWVVEFERIDG